MIANRKKLCAILCLALASVGPAYALTNEELLELVLAGSKQTVSSIKSGMGKVTVDDTRKDASGVAESETQFAFEYYFSGDKTALTMEQILVKPGGQYKPPAGLKAKERALIDGQKVYVLSVIDNYGLIGSLATDAGHHVTSFLRLIGIWKRGLSAPDGSADNIPGRIIRVTGSESVNGRQCVIVEFSWTDKYADSKDTQHWHSYWIDTERGYSTLRARSWYAGGDTSISKTLEGESNTEVKDYGNGIWAPTKITSDTYNVDLKTADLKSIKHRVITYDLEFKINQPVPDEKFLPLEFPSGTRVSDELLNATYTVP
ncbi:MAG: hypothetical protein Q7T82_17340 [Armatimonadota bacterium]|nr:hypothetical protein [Armatimonadota bacterium]